MNVLKSLKRLINNEAKCALCLAKVPRQTTIELFKKDVCDWCVNYYSKAFPKDWREKIKLMLFL